MGREDGGNENQRKKRRKLERKRVHLRMKMKGSDGEVEKWRDGRGRNGKILRI